MHLLYMNIKEKKINVFQKQKNLEIVIQKNYWIFMNQKYHFSKKIYLTMINKFN